MQSSHYPAKLQYLQDTLFGEKAIQVGLLRLDEIHPVVSGNKLFKLYYFLQQAYEAANEGIVSFGGPYSNHLVATAFACQQQDLTSVGFVRGEAPFKLSHTLTACISYGMQLRFIPRETYAKQFEADFLHEVYESYPNYLVVPEGGYHPTGAAGAALILNNIPPGVTHICCPVGTATTVAGLLLGVHKEQQVVAFPALKGMTDLTERLNYLTNARNQNFRLQMMDGYHFGGYAKKNSQLIEFMNDFYHMHGIPTDMVYTAKMMFGVIDCIRKDFFPAGSHIVCLHTGGLQGNLSLPAGTLVF